MQFRTAEVDLNSFRSLDSWHRWGDETEFKLNVIVWCNVGDLVCFLVAETSHVLHAISRVACLVLAAPNDVSDGTCISFGAETTQRVLAIKQSFRCQRHGVA